MQGRPCGAAPVFQAGTVVPAAADLFYTPAAPAPFPVLPVVPGFAARSL
jgi:hypothetical protein